MVNKEIDVIDEAEAIIKKYRRKDSTTDEDFLTEIRELHQKWFHISNECTENCKGFISICFQDLERKRVKGRSSGRR